MSKRAQGWIMAIGFSLIVYGVAVGATFWALKGLGVL